jgi:hypothetical protein
VIYPNEVTTYTRIFKKDVVVSNTANAIPRYGRSGTEFDYVANRQLLTLKKEFENALFNDYAVAPSTTATAGSFDGIYERIGATNYSDLSGAALTLDNVRTAVRAIADYGGSPSVICCSLYTKDVFDSWGNAHVQHITDPQDPTVMLYGGAVSRLFVGGKVLDIVTCDSLNSATYILTEDMLKILPLRPFQLIPVGVDGDRMKAMVIGEYSFECANPRAHYVFTSCKWTV